jgi:hypothetical protein
VRTNSRLAATACAALLFVGCGGDDAADEPPTTQGERPVPAYDPAPDLPSLDGYLLSATESRVVLQRPHGGRVTFRVKPADVERLGLRHLASHAGLTDVGFRVYYTREGDRRFIKYAKEIPPPPRATR